MRTRGVVVGKFYPPHRGHKHLIDTAQAQADELTVIVCARADDAIPGHLRAAWLREIHPDVHVMLVEDRYPPDDSRLWAELTVHWLGYVPDVCFTSEDYGARWARCIGCRHVLVDRHRTRVPISGTMIRENPLAHLDFLEPCVRAYFVKRVVVLGAESTGTTTLARALAAHFRTCWVPEYGRFYYEGRMHVNAATSWRSEEFVHIAEAQNRMEEALARIANRVLICDTDAFATTIWHERYVGRPSPGVAALARGRRYDLYLLTSTDVPFVQDGTRDGEHIRQWMHDRFVEELRRWGKPHVVLSGSHAERMRVAAAEIDRLLVGATRR